MTETLTSRSRALLEGGDLSAMTKHHPFTAHGELEEVTDGVGAISSFANVAAIDSGDGLVLVDTGGPMAARSIRDLIRTWRTAPVHSAVYTHGHIDHVFGTAAFDAEADERRAASARG